MKKRLLTVAVGDPLRLAELLVARLALPPEEATRLCEEGAVTIVGRRITDGNAELAVGTRVTVHFDGARAAPVELVVRYADTWVAVVDKPAGMPSQATRATAAGTLEAAAQARFGPATRLLHRLDRDASGLVLVTVDRKARAPLQAALAAGEIDRRYLAVVAGTLRGEGRITHRIGRDFRDSTRRAALPEGAPGGEPAATRYRALGPAGPNGADTRVELTLETGRTHQIRLHLAAIGHPLVGDRLYGGRPSERLWLHAVQLRWPHPADGKIRTVRSDPPPGFVPPAAPTDILG